MKIRVLCVGKVKEEFYRNRIREFSEQLNRQVKTEITEVEDERTPDGSNELNLNKIREAEGERLLHYLPKNAEELVIALCIDGKKYDQDQMRGLIKRYETERGISQVTYIIGGSVGLDERVVRRADVRLSFSDMTFPHQLMRVMLLEQLMSIHYL
ncbi:MAG: 23S rRNA (pseudouridine(1915)-N(3))-methyltransferase RlmH [Clostridium sp.]|nr:23S rRNA (pseudouridine(1915)-N(3))-methyltransferase RlmH [Clostridium sp.]